MSGPKWHDNAYHFIEMVDIPYEVIPPFDSLYPITPDGMAFACRGCLRGVDLEAYYKIDVMGKHWLICPYCIATLLATGRVSDDPQRVERNVPPALRKQIIQFHDYTCQYCDRKGTPDADPDGLKWHVDHVTPISFGGSNALENLTLACRTCNLRKGSKGLEDFMGRGR